MERLSRGVIAMRTGEKSAYISWRLLGNDPENIRFSLYRQSGNSMPVKISDKSIVRSTDFTDYNADFSNDITYTVRSIINGKETEDAYSFCIKAGTIPKQYLSIPLRTPDRYTPGDCSVGDLDGDGEYEVVVHMTGIGRDNSQSGLTTPPILQAYKLDGTFLWEINLGKNIREGAHYTQFLVYDFDGDGRAEIICKTADGTIDGTGKVIGNPYADWRVKPANGNMDPWAGWENRFYRRPSKQEPKQDKPSSKDSSHISPVYEDSGLIAGSRRMPPIEGRRLRPAFQDTDRYAGKIFDGPEYLTVFEGKTGKALATVDYVPPRGERKLWGDDNGNRSERYLACVAWLDGKHPSAVMCRGYYTRAFLAAWDWHDGKLTQRWTFDSYDGTPGNDKYSGQGCHSVSVADVDHDGCDEIVYGSCVIDHNGKGLYSTGKGHGDALHCSDLDPKHPGLEVFMVHEDIRRSEGVTGGDFRDARTGKILWGLPATEDAGRGMTADIDPRYPGCECWSAVSKGLFSAQGKKISDRKPRSCNFAVWWDGDLIRELLDKNIISKWDWKTGSEVPVFKADDCLSINGTKATPCLSADLFGDWREEVIFRSQDNKELRIFTTIIPTKYRFVTLMHDPQYRAAIAWQNVAYNQPPHPGFFLGTGMKKHKPVKISIVNK